MSDLVKVTFDDLTNYQTYQSNDLPGIPMDYFWGPVDILRTYNRDQFEIIVRK